MAAITRHWSTVLNGIQTDEAQFRAEIGKIVANVKRAAGQAPGRSRSSSPTVRARWPRSRRCWACARLPEAIPRQRPRGRLAQFRDVQLSPATALSRQVKELVGLAVASQVPCRYCIIAHTEFAKLNGATDAEITEAIAMAALTRNISTMLNGLEVDEAAVPPRHRQGGQERRRRQEGGHHRRALTRSHGRESAGAALDAAPAFRISGG